MGIGGILEGLPGLQEVLGFFAKFIPGLGNYVEGGKLTKIPNLFLLTPPGAPFLVPHIASSFLPGIFPSAGGDPPQPAVEGGGEGRRRASKGQHRLSCRLSLRPSGLCRGAGPRRVQPKPAAETSLHGGTGAARDTRVLTRPRPVQGCTRGIIVHHWSFT